MQSTEVAAREWARRRRAAAEAKQKAEDEAAAQAKQKYEDEANSLNPSPLQSVHWI